MKLFQQLLLAPAALGLLAPLAANAAEVNINDVSSYANKSVKQVSALRDVQFSDVVPGDWAYTALQNLSKSYGCVDNIYTKNLENGQALTRYEAAALVNACLDDSIVSADADSDATRLVNEFGTEMTILKGRGNVLGSATDFNAGGFSPSTKVSGKVVFNTGAMELNTSNTDAQMGEKLTSAYVAQYNVNTSFTGEDRLYTRIKAGNMGTTPWEDTAHGTHLSAAHNSGGTNELQVDKLWYEFPLGQFKVWAGPRIENYYMLASSPSIYKPVMKQFALGGNGAIYGSSTDGGFGIAWTQETESRSDARWAIATNYVSKGASDATEGLLTNEEDAKWLTKIEYGSPRMQVSLAYTENICGPADSNCRNWASYYSTTTAATTTGDSKGVGLRAYWMPEETGLIPAVQFGIDKMDVDDDNTATAVEATMSWMAGFTWKDAFQDGNRLATAFGSPTKATSINNGSDDPAQDAFTWEVYYDYAVNDGVTITPAIFGSTDRMDGNANGHDDFWGALVQTTFKF